MKAGKPLVQNPASGTGIAVRPSTDVIERNLKEVKGTLSPEDWNKYSAHYLCDYRVGKTHRLSTPKRRKILDSFFASQLNPLIERLYGNVYDRPRSRARPLKMANVIASNCRNFKRRSNAHRYHQAIAEYEEDLEYLRRTYFDPSNPDPWPGT